ncbi:MAG: hypothetical protein ACJAU2_001500 [Maribacter sp.]|jgi:hypothetical protein
MNVKLIFRLLFLVSVTAIAQDKKWSVEANYPISIAGKLGNDNPGIVDLGIKYRFLDLKVARIGAGFNAGVFYDKIQSGLFDPATSRDFTETNWLFQPKLFSEFQIAGIPKLRPSIGLGYTFIRSNFKGQARGETFDSGYSESGFNFNVGLSYDITDKLFIQGQYDNIRYSQDFRPTDNLGFLKFGLGFRF